MVTTTDVYVDIQWWSWLH